jgi:hypothetical protein
MHASSSPVQPGADGPAVPLTDSERIADLERDLADLTDLVGQYLRPLSARRTIERAASEAGGWQPARRPAARSSRLRHLRTVRSGS